METMRWRVVVFVGTMLVSPFAQASTELHGGAWFWNALSRGEPAGEARSDATAQTGPMAYPTERATSEDASLDDWAFAVDGALLRGDSAAPAATKVDRFKWAFLLIGFAGLTAFFTGRRTGGRGLISV